MNDGFVGNDVSNIPISNTKISDCIIVDMSNGHKGSYYFEEYISKIVWSKSLGLVYYEYENGDKFQRIF